VIKKFRRLGSSCATVSKVLETKDKVIYRAIQDGIETYNEEVDAYHQVCTFTIS